MLMFFNNTKVGGKQYFLEWKIEMEIAIWMQFFH